MKPVDPTRRLLDLEAASLTPTAEGVLLQVNAKPRAEGHPGLPKQARSSLRITEAGAEGDYNHYRAKSLDNDPAQAILLVTEEVLHTLNAEGWPARPGDLGENLTVRLPEALLKPGSRVEIGAVVLEVSLACTPCTELYTLSFVGQERGPEFLRTMKGRRGWYARVLAGGEVRPGMPARVSAPASLPSPAD
jgi:MOSC domain-containing protein YiiM